MQTILNDMNRALNARASYAALATAVTLPEICGRCELVDMLSTKGAGRAQFIFQKFVDKYLKSWSIGLTGDDLYYLRNGVSHRGQVVGSRMPVRYVFTPPNDAGHIIHNNRNRSTNTLNIDLRVFCGDIERAVMAWMMDNKANPVAQKNMENVLQPRQGDFGTGIYVEGMEWLA